MQRTIVFTAALMLGAPSALAGDAVVAVFDIEVDGNVKKRTAKRLSEYLAGQLAEVASYRIVPRASLKKQLTAQKTASYDACYDEACQIEIGKAVAAEKALSTQLIQFGKHCILKSVLYDLRAEVSEKVKTEKGACSDEALIESVERLASGLAEAPVAPASRTPPPPSDTAAVEAPPPPPPTVGGAREHAAALIAASMRGRVTMDFKSQVKGQTFEFRTIMRLTNLDFEDRGCTLRVTQVGGGRGTFAGKTQEQPEKKTDITVSFRELSPNGISHVPAEALFEKLSKSGGMPEFMRNAEFDVSPPGVNALVMPKTSGDAKKKNEVFLLAPGEDPEAAKAHMRALIRACAKT